MGNCTAYCMSCKDMGPNTQADGTRGSVYQQQMYMVKEDLIRKGDNNDVFNHNNQLYGSGEQNTKYSNGKYAAKK